MTRRKKKEVERKKQSYLRKRHKMCTGKRSYSTVEEANGYAKMYSDPRYNHGRHETYTSYLCPLCNKFHLTTHGYCSKINA